MLNSEFIKDKFFDKYIYKVEFAKMLHIPNAIHRHRHGHIRFVQTGIFFTE